MLAASSVSAFAAGAAALAAHVPYFHLGGFDTGVVTIQAFGVLVAAGVLIGAALLRRYAEWHGIDDEHIRGLTGWVTLSGFAGAHLFDVLFYQWDKLTNSAASDYVGPLLLVKVWDGISSYGGFIGGALGFAFYVWWKRLPARLMADITIVGLLPAFSIGRIGCTVVSDHIGAAVDSAQWYAWLAMNYPLKYTSEGSLAVASEGHPNDTQPAIAAMAHDVINAARTTHTPPPDFFPAWNLGLIEFLWLVPVNALVLWLAFRASKRINAGFIVVITGVLYAPVRFLLDFLRPESSDPRYGGLTFAQWISIVAFAVAIYVAARISKNGTPAETVAYTSGEAQAKLKSILKEQEAAEEAKERRRAQKGTKKKKPKPAGEPTVEGKKAEPEAKPEAKSEPDADAT